MQEQSINLNIEALRNRSIFLATPMYGGECSGFYTKSVLDLMIIFQTYGLNIRFFSLFNESLIPRARNYCADEFMRSGCTDLLFIDADIEFNPMDVLGLMHFSESDDVDIIGGVYPKKAISWEKIKAAVDKGFGDENPFVLDNYAGDFVFNPVGSGEHAMNSPMEVMEIGTGFMMVKRRTFEKWDQERPQYKYYPDHARQKDFDGTRKITAYFQDPIVNERHLSEDYFFCQESRKMGMKVWICPWMNLNHIGTYKFVGNLAAVAATGMSATADLEEVKGSKV